MISSPSRIIFRRIIPLRCFHTTQTQRIDPKNVEEIKIPVPWGHVAGKWWGKKSIQPVLALHGWQDNAGSWDPLAELMPDDISILALDFPGHGLSSHIPQLQNYYYNDAIHLINKIKSHYGWGKIDLLGHSDGSSVCFRYSTIFPENVKSYFGIDFIIGCCDVTQQVQDMGNQMKRKLELGLRDKESSGRYTWDEALSIWVKGTNSSLRKETAEILMKRGVKKMSNGKYIFSRDHRVKTDDLYLFNSEEVYELAKNIDCHVNLIRGTKTPYFDYGLHTCPDILDLLKKHSRSFALYDVDGKHHLHMDVPEKIVTLLVDSLLQK